MAAASVSRRGSARNPQESLETDIFRTAKNNSFCKFPNFVELVSAVALVLLGPLTVVGRGEGDRYTSDSKANYQARWAEANPEFEAAKKKAISVQHRYLIETIPLPHPSCSQYGQKYININILSLVKELCQRREEHGLISLLSVLFSESVLTHVNRRSERKTTSHNIIRKRIFLWSIPRLN
jgi:hypothetical protein